MPTAIQQKSGKWRVQISINGRRRSITAPTKKEAERMAAKAMIERRNPIIHYSVAEAIDDYITSKSSVLSPSTIRSHRACQRNYFDEIGPIYIGSLTNRVVQMWISSLTERVSAKSVHNIYGLFTAALRFADPTIRFNVSLPKKYSSMPVVPTEEQVQQLMDLANPQMRLAICLAAFGTMRRGEICGLRYKDLDRDNCTIKVQRVFVLNEYGEWVDKPFPKNETSMRTIQLPKEVIDMIPESNDMEEKIVKMMPSGISSGFYRLQQKTGIDASFHSLRRFAVSILHTLGVPDQYIQKRGGWKNDNVMKMAYRNTISNQEQRFTDMANDYFSDNYFR